MTLIGKVHPNGEFEPSDGKSKERVNVKDGRIYFVVDGKEQELGRILPDGEIEPLGESKDKKGKARQLTPEEMQALLKAEKAKRKIDDSDQKMDVTPGKLAAKPQTTIILSSSDGNIAGILNDGTVKRIGKLSSDGNFEPFDDWAKDNICVKDGIIYQLFKIGKVLPNGKIEPIREKVDSEIKIPPAKFEVTQDGLIISHGGTGLNCFIGEVLPNGEVKPKDGWSCDFRVRDGIIYLVHNGKEEEIGRITEEMKEGFEKRRLEGEKLVENLEKMRRKKLEEKLKNGGEK